MVPDQALWFMRGRVTMWFRVGLIVAVLLIARGHAQTLRSDQAVFRGDPTTLWRWVSSLNPSISPPEKGAARPTTGW